MQLKPFLLDLWLDNYEHGIEFNLAASTGPSWTLNEILSLGNDEERERFLNQKLVYGRPAGSDGLRTAIAEMYKLLRRSYCGDSYCGDSYCGDSIPIYRRFPARYF